MWKLPQRQGPDVSEIEHDHAESTGLQDEIHRLQRAIGITRFPDPEQASNIDAGGRGGQRIEAIVGIHERDGLSAPGGRRRDGRDQRRSSRRPGANHLG